MNIWIKYGLPEDRQAHLRHLKSLELCRSLGEMDQWLRNKIEYGEREEFREVRDQLNEIMDDNNINLDEIYS